jgi:hypothetical protein
MPAPLAEPLLDANSEVAQTPGLARQLRYLSQKNLVVKKAQTCCCFKAPFFALGAEILFPVILVVGFTLLSLLDFFEPTTTAGGWTVANPVFSQAPPGGLGVDVTSTFSRPASLASDGDTPGMWSRASTTNALLMAYATPSTPFGINPACGRACQRSNCTRIAVTSASGSAADQARVRTFVNHVNTEWHQGYNASQGTVNPDGHLEGTIPSFAQSTTIFASQAQLEDYIGGSTYDSAAEPGCQLTSACQEYSATGSCLPSIGAAIVFESLEDGAGVAGDWKYSVRVQTAGSSRDGNFPELGTLQPPVLFSQGIRNRFSNAYARSGFLTLQALVDRYILNERIPAGDARNSAAARLAAVSIAFHPPTAVGYGAPPSTVPVDPILSAQLAANNTELFAYLSQEMLYAPTSVSLITMPSYEFTSSIFFTIVSFLFPLVFVLMCVMSVFLAHSNILQEKETKTRELLRIMGVSNAALMGSWYLLYSVVYAAMALLVAVAANLGLFKNSSLGLLWLFFFVFFMNFIAIAYFVSAFFR